MENEECKITAVNMKRTTTMHDVAKLACVSQATVSHVINNSAPVSEEVRSRVLDAIKTLGYVPNFLAKGLKGSSTNTIALLVPEINNPYYSAIVKRLEEILRKENKLLFLACTSGDSQRELQYIKEFISYNIQGAIITYSLSNSHVLQLLQDYGIPCVVLDDIPGKSEVPVIEISNEYGGYLATKHLIQSGCRHIAVVSEPLVKLPLAKRICGYSKALAEAGITYSKILLADAPQDAFEIGYRKADQLIDGEVDGVFATSDYLAYGVLRLFLECGVKIPEDIGLIGYDDVAMTQVSRPALSTIAQPIQEMSELGTRMLLNQIKGKEAEKHYLLQPELRIRDTTAQDT